jgi:two-component system, NarL family, sensor histidine kinase FusK
MSGASWKNWLKQGMAVLGYAAGYWVLQQISFPYWVLFAGFRLAMLIFVPRRYWAALAVGELAPLGYLALSNASQYGMAWAALTIFPTPIVLAMPLVHMCKSRLRMLPARGGVRMGVLLLSMLLVTGLWTLMNTGRLAVTHVPADYQVDYVTALARWFIGNLLGTLTVVPLAVWVRETWRSASAAERWRPLLDSRLLMESAFLLVPALGLLVWIAAHATTQSSENAAQMAMFLPVVMLALRHGWQGAAVGGSLASVAVVLTMKSMDDAGAMQAETFIAFAISSMLLLGSRISVLNQRDAAERIEVQEALVLARRNINIGEARLRVAAEFLEQIREMIHVGYEHMLTQLRHAPAIDSRLYTRQAATVQEQLFRLSDGLYPNGWRDKNLLVTLRQGPLARALDEAGVSYWCDARGDFSQMSSGLHLDVYRLVGECLTLACEILPPTHVHVRLRVLRIGGRSRVGVRMRAWTEPDQVASIRLNDVRLRLGSAGLSWAAAEDRVRSYQGRLRHTTSAHGHVISAVLPDPEPLPKATRDPASWVAGGEITVGKK